MGSDTGSLKATITAFHEVTKPNEPVYITVEDAFEAIRSNKHLQLVTEIRAQVDKEHRDAIKKRLPGVCWSGKFTRRHDSALEQHSGLMVLDFDDVAMSYREKLQKDPHTYACWLSPSGNGFKVLVHIWDGAKHRQHFNHIRKNLWPECDASGVNESRFCFESHDPELYINPDAKVYTKTLEEETYTYREPQATDKTFDKLLVWLANKGKAFNKGERNDFIFRLAGACCRFGLNEWECEGSITSRFLGRDTDFTKDEALQAIRSAYKKNKASFGTAKFDERDRLVTGKSSTEIDLAELEPTIDENGRHLHIIYADDVRVAALRIKNFGYEKADSIGIDELDFKIRRGEVTLISGIGNHGKSAFLKQLQLCDHLVNGTKWCTYAPEEFGAEDYYHDFVEMYEGCRLSPTSPTSITDAEYLAKYDYLGQHFFYYYPKDFIPDTDQYLEQCLKMHITTGVTRFAADPYNRIRKGANSGKIDQYLEADLDKYDRFAKQTQTSFFIVAHPNSLSKDGQKDYPCPDVFDLAGGAMWNNKMDNIGIYHRPFKTTDPRNPLCEFHKKKIKKQKIVGKPGVVMMDFSDVRGGRFLFNGRDPISDILRAKDNPRNGITTINYSEPRHAQTIPDESFWNE